MGGFDTALAGPHGAGVSAHFDAEQLGFGQAFRQGRAIKRDKSARAPGIPMQCLSQRIFAGAGFTLDHDIQRVLHQLA